MTILSKININAVLEKGSVQKRLQGAPATCRFEVLACFLLIMLIFGHFWGPLKNQGGAKNEPKNSIRRLFGTPGRPKGAKKSFLEGVKKRIDF